MAKPPESSEVHIVNVERGRVTFCLLGTAPLLHNCLSNKAKHELLLPMGRKTEAERKTTLKHQPHEEFRESIYYNSKPGSPTLVQHLSSAFRGAMRSAALDLPGVTKSEIGRLLWVEGDRVDIYGVPLLDMRIVRQAGMNRSPDVRTRCIMREWACAITVAFTKPQLKEQAVANLITAAGLYIGIGDYRNEKGAGNYGLFRVCDANDPDYVRICKSGGRKVQDAAMKTPEPFNEETAELLTWFEGAVAQHRTFAPLTTKGKRGKGASEVAS
jgi:hypothetical protein